MTGRWFRFYESVVDDPKVQRLSDAAFRAWVNLMCIASRNDGKISADLADICFALRLKEGKARELLQVLQSAGLIERFETEYMPHNWNGRQFKSDVSTDRVKRFREQQRNVSETANETPPETEQKQNRTEQKETPSLRSGGAAKRERRVLLDLPEAFPGPDELDEARAFWAEKQRFDIAAPDESAKFRDYHAAHGTKMKNWNAAWGTWFRNAVDFKKPERANGNGREKTGYSAFIEGAYAAATDDALGHSLRDES